MIDAPHTGLNVEKVALTGWYKPSWTSLSGRNALAARRPPEPPACVAAAGRRARLAGALPRPVAWPSRPDDAVAAPGSSMRRVLIVTNDFPPRRGGIQSFVHALAARLPEDAVCVYAPAWDGAAGFDARQPFPVVRHRTSLMLPVPTVARRAAGILAAYDCDTVLFGAAAPLGLLAPRCAGPAPSGSWPSRTATRPAGRPCPWPGRCCAGSATRSTS